MPSILETVIACKIADKIDERGSCNHPAEPHNPFGVTIYESDSIKRYSQEQFEKLKLYGVNEEEIILDDVMLVSEIMEGLVKDLELREGDKQEYLYKHAVAKRLNIEILCDRNLHNMERFDKCVSAFGNTCIKF